MSERPATAFQTLGGGGSPAAEEPAEQEGFQTGQTKWALKKQLRLPDAAGRRSSLLGLTVAAAAAVVEAHQDLPVTDMLTQLPSA